MTTMSQTQTNGDVCTICDPECPLYQDSDTPGPTYLDSFILGVWVKDELTQVSRSWKQRYVCKHVTD